MHFGACLVLFCVAVLAQGDDKQDTPCIVSTIPETGQDVHMTCIGLTSMEDLVSASKKAEIVHWLHLKNCTLPSLPLGLPRSLVHLHIVDSIIPYLVSPLSGWLFKETTNLSTIVVKGVQDLTGWDWQEVKVLENLKKIHIEDSRLPVLPKVFGSFGKNFYWSLNVTNCKTIHIDTDALASSSLYSFAFRGNMVKTLKQDMFRYGATVELEFANNMFTGLDYNVFTNLRNLHQITVDADFLKLLSPSQFSKNTLSAVIIGESPPCKCRYSFLLQYGLKWKEFCVLETSTLIARFIFAEFLINAC